MLPNFTQTMSPSTYAICVCSHILSTAINHPSFALKVNRYAISSFVRQLNYYIYIYVYLYMCAISIRPNHKTAILVYHVAVCNENVNSKNVLSGKIVAIDWLIGINI